MTERRRYQPSRFRPRKIRRFSRSRDRAVRYRQPDDAIGRRLRRRPFEFARACRKRFRRFPRLPPYGMEAPSDFRARSVAEKAFYCPDRRCQVGGTLTLRSARKAHPSLPKGAVWKNGLRTRFASGEYRFWGWGIIGRETIRFDKIRPSGYYSDMNTRLSFTSWHSVPTFREVLS